MYNFTENNLSFSQFQFIVKLFRVWQICDCVSYEKFVVKWRHDNDVASFVNNQSKVKKLIFFVLSKKLWSKSNIAIQSSSSIVFWFSSSVTQADSVARTFFLENTNVRPKKHEKHETKSPKTQEKHEYFTKISENLTLPYFFIAFLCMNIFQNSRISHKNLISYKLLKKFVWKKIFDKQD